MKKLIGNFDNFQVKEGIIPNAIEVAQAGDVEKSGWMGPRRRPKAREPESYNRFIGFTFKRPQPAAGEGSSETKDER